MPASGSDILQLRRGTAAAWTAANPVLAEGELGLETDTAKLKAGDGVTAWVSLGYLTGGGGTPGATGANGRDGFIVFPDDGEDGMFVPGAQGAAGTAGSAGGTGPTGPAGAASTTPGPPGEDADEVTFLPGVQGATGAAGASVTGATGAAGRDGVPAIHDDIPDEAVFLPGPQGATGAQGASVTGATGATGATVPGFAGDDGDDGMFIPGAIGATGPSGGAGTQTAFTKDLGIASAGTFDVTGLSGLTADKSYDVRQSGAQIASKGNARDEAEMDTIICTAYALDTTSLRVLWQAPSTVVGTYAFVSIT